MTNADLIEMTRKALGDQQVMERLFKQSFAYDATIHEEFRGNYSVLPDAIYPVRIGAQVAIAVVRAKVTRDGRDKLYSFVFEYTPDGLDIRLAYPGTSHTTPQLFHDVYPAALAATAGKLRGGHLYLKDTRLLGPVRESGWDESWHWIDEKGAEARIDIAFTTAPGAEGASYSIHSD